MGISKAYTTRVGAGPFPTELHGEAGDRLREAGSEYGATTGRPRRCGWLDVPALRFAARVNGLTGLALTKLDVLATMSEVQVCTGYEDGLQPGRDDLGRAVPILRDVSGFGDSSMAEALRAARRPEEIPAPARAYLDLVAETVGVEVALVSVGPRRDQTIVLADAFEPR